MWRKVRTYFKYYFFGKYSFIKTIEVPEKFDRFTIYIIEDWSIAFECPCGCVNDIHLNILPEVSPKWSYKIKKSYINITPSINRTRGCKSHFWIRKGKVYWC